MTTAELLSETREAAIIRERNSFAKVAGDKAASIVLFGAGTLGRKIARSLKLQGTAPLAFADNDPKLAGKKVNDIEVFSLKDACQRWGKTAVFVVCIFHPNIDEGMQSRLEELRAHGCQTITTFFLLAWRLENVLPHFGADLPSRILLHARELTRIDALLIDDQSRETFRQQLAWRLHGDFSEAGPPTPDQYFPADLILPNHDECFVDGGAYDGDTLRVIPWPTKKVWAIEPDPENLRRLESKKLPGLSIHNVALGAKPGIAAFNARGTMASSIDESGSTNVPVTTLDLLLANERPTFLKLDIEGEELSALEGGRKLLKEAAPVVAVCIYHKAEDLWQIPTFLQESLSQHRFALRVHARDGFELVYYAIPEGRLKHV